MKVCLEMDGSVVMRDKFSLNCPANLVLAGVSLCLEGLGSKAQVPVVICDRQRACRLIQRRVNRYEEVQ